MATGKTVVPLRRLNGLVVTVRPTREFKFRVFVAIFLFRVAAWVLGGRVEIEGDEDD